MKKIILALVSITLLVSCTGNKNKTDSNTTTEVNNIKAEKKMEKVHFVSNGVKLTGDLFYPANYKEGKQYPAVIVTGAWTTVKEQMPNLYAKKLAEKGFITLTFDFRGWGESEGKERFLEDPIRKTEDIKAAATYLNSLAETKDVGGLGVCASSGYMVKAYAEGAFKSVALVAPWLHNQEIATAVYGGEESVKKLLAVSDKAQKDFDKNGNLQLITAASTTDENSLMYQAPYYTEKDRGLIPEFDNKFNLASWRPWLTFDAIQYANKIPNEILFVESEAMALPQGSEAFKAIAKDKVKSVNLPNVTQFDFYDKPEPVAKAVDRVAEFMKATL